MQLGNYPSCCGAKILYNFGYSASASYLREELEEEPELHENAAKPTKEQFLDDLAHYKKVFNSLGMFTLILDSIQQPIIGPWIEEGDGKLVATAGNDGGECPIYLYVIILNEAE